MSTFLHNSKSLIRIELGRKARSVCDNICEYFLCFTTFSLRRDKKKKKKKECKKRRKQTRKMYRNETGIGTSGLILQIGVQMAFHQRASHRISPLIGLNAIATWPLLSGRVPVIVASVPWMRRDLSRRSISSFR